MNLDKFKKIGSSHYHHWGICKGIVLNVIPADHKENSTGDRLEYTIKVGKGHVFDNVISVCDLGAIYNYSETIKKNTEDILDESAYNEKRDGEHVLVAFLEGNSEVPIIIGSLEHPRHPQYKKSLEANGRQHIFEYNGIEYKIDKNGTLTFEQIGLKDVNGEITNPDATGAKISIDGITGNIILEQIESLNAEGEDRNIDATGAKISVDGATGDILIQDKDSNKIELVGGVANITVTGNANITTEGDANIIATGNVTLDTDGDIILNSANNVSANGTGLVADGNGNSDPITGIPLVAIGGVKVGT